MPDETPPGFVPDVEEEELPPGFITEEAFEDQELEKDATIFAAFNGTKGLAADRRADILRIARETGAPADVVETKFDDISHAWQLAQLDPRVWRQSNPALSELLLAQPDVAPVAVMDQQLSALGRLRRMAQPTEEEAAAKAQQAGPLSPEEEAQAQASEAQLPGFLQRMRAAVGAPRSLREVEQRQAQQPGPEVRQPLGKVSYKVDPTADYTGLERFRTYAAAYQQAAKQTELSELGAGMLLRKKTGQDTWDLEKKAADLEHQLAPRFYGQGSMEQSIFDALGIAPSMKETLVASGVGGAAGAALGAVAGGLGTRSAEGAKKGALLGLKLGSRAAASARSFQLEAGGAYLEIRKEKTDDGKLVDDDVAAGAAVSYGLVAAAIEAELLPVELEAFGPLGEAVAKGSGKAFVKQMLKDVTARQLLKKVGVAWLKGAAAEGVEEGTQQAAQELFTYLARVASAGETQKADVAGGLERSFEAASTAFTGSLVLGAGSASVNLTTQTIQLGQAKRAGERVALLNQVAQTSTTVKAAPALVAKLVEQHTAESGDPVRNVYVDPAAFTRLYQSENADPAEAAAQLMGEEGPRKLQEALATGQKLEVPLAEYLEKWGPKPVAQALAADTTTSPAYATPRELQALDAQVQAQARAIAEAFQAQQAEETAQAPPAVTAEQRFAEDLARQLVATGQYDEASARQAAALHTAVRQVLGARFGVDPDVLFRRTELRIESSTSATQGALQQAGRSEQLLRAMFGRLAEVERASARYRDAVTGLLNARAFGELPAPADRPLVGHVSVEGAKFLNDTQGHEQANRLLRAVASAIQQESPEVAKVGGDFAVRVADQAELDQLLERVRQRLPAAFRGFSLTGQVGATLEEASAGHGAAKAAAEASGARAPRGQRPLGVTEGLAVPEAGPAQGALPAALLARARELGTSEEAFQDVYREAATGLLNATGWEALRATAPKKFVASIDLNGLKAVNAGLGQRAGDLLLERFGAFLARRGDAAMDWAHLHGDEYAVQADDEQTLRAHLATLRVLAQNVGEGGSDATVSPFGFGVGQSLEEADAALNADKQRLSERGQRGSDADARRLANLQRQAAAAPGNGSGDRRQGAGEEGAGADRGGVQPTGGPGAGRGGGQAGSAAPAVAAQRFEQPSKAGPRGAVEISREAGKKLYKVILTPNADLSTFLHESGHIFLDMLAELAGREDAPERVKADLAATLKWMGLEKAEDIQADQHEKWARAWEAYLYEGKAPTSGLVRAFTRFRLWLREVYAGVRSLVKEGELSPQIRGVFDRLLATDEEIARVQTAMGLKPLFRSPADAGMSPEQWQAYLDEQERAQSRAQLAVTQRVLADQLRETEKWWKAAERKARKEAEAEYDALPAARAWRELRKGEMTGPDGQVLLSGLKLRMDKQAVEELVGPAAAATYAGLLVKEGGEHPDTVAELYGFSTGKELLAAITSLPERDEWAAERAGEKMRQAHPDILDERTKLQELVAKGLHGDATSDWLLREWAVLREKAYVLAENPEANTQQAIPKERLGFKAPPVEAIRLAAKQIAERHLVRRLEAGQALQAERVAADKAAVAAARGDWAAAYVFKQQQLLNHYLYRELGAARELRDSFEDLAGQLAKDKTRAKLGKADVAYRDGIDQVLEALGLKEEEKREGPPVPLSELVRTMEANGDTVAFDSAQLAQVVAAPRNWVDLTVAELRNVHTALKNIRQSGYNRLTALVEGKRVERAEVVTELLAAAARNLPSLGPATSSVAGETALQAAGGLVSSIDGSLLAPETMVGWLAGGDLQSMWYRAVVLPLQQAKHAEADLLKTTIRPIVEAFTKIPAEVRRRMFERVDGKALFPGHREDLDPPGRRFELMMLALNVGNESNLQRLTEGRGITTEQIRAALDLLTKEEVTWVQTVLDQAESLWPAAKALEERDAGVAPPKIEPRPFPVANGTISGYFPAVYDRRVEVVGERQAAQAVADLMDPSYTRPGTAHSHLKSRAEQFAGALTLDPTVVQAHLAQVAHDLAFREPLKSIGSLVLDPEVQGALKQRLGDGRARVFLQWLKDIGQMRGAEVASHTAGLNRLVRGLRSNMVIGTLGYAADVALGDLANVLVGATVVKVKHWAAGFGQFVASPFATTRFAEEKSGELRFRHDALTQEMGQQLRKMTTRNPLRRGPLGFLVEHAFTFMEFSDRVTVTPVWVGAYRQALAEGKEEGDAVTFADATVRKIFPSRSAVDRAAILRDKGFWGLTTLFYGYFNTLYNRSRDIVHELHLAEDGVDVARRLPRVGGRLFALYVASAVVAEFLSGRGPEPDDGDDDEERWVQWFLRKLLVAPVQTLPGPVSSLVESGLLHKAPSVRAAPAFAVLEGLGKAAWNALQGEADAEKTFFEVTRSLGLLVGFPTKLLRAARYAVDAAQGEANADNPADVLSGILYGQRPNQPLNPASSVGNVIEDR